MSNRTTLRKLNQTRPRVKPMDINSATALAAVEKRMLRQYPNHTVVLNAKTLKPLFTSSSPTQTAKKLKHLPEDIVPIFIGPKPRCEVVIHYFCG